MPFPITPAIILLPFVFFWGVGFKTIYIMVFIGALNVALMYALLRHINSNKILCMLLTFAFAFGTVHWWVTAKNGAPFLSHIFATLFLILAIIESVTQKRPVILGLLIGCAFMCRQMTIFSFPYFVYILLNKNYAGLFTKDYKTFFTNKYVRKALVFIAILFLFILTYGTYNYLRFGNPLDTGYQYINLGNPLQERFADGGLFSFHHLPFNLFIFLFQAPIFVFRSFHWSSPFIQFDPQGLALIFTSPFILAAFRNFSRKTWPIWISCIFVFLPELFYYNTGWVQFGYRFFLDVIPFFMLLIGLSKFNTRDYYWFVPLIAYSILINCLGVIFLT